MASQGRKKSGQKAAASISHETRVEAGKKAARTRGRESLSAAERKGVKRSYGGGRKKEEY